MSSFSLKPEGAVSRLEKIYAVKQKACKILNSQLAPAEEARRLFQDAENDLEKVLEDYPGYYFAMVLLAETYFEKCKATLKLPAVSERSKAPELLSKSLKLINTLLGENIEAEAEDVYCLFAEIVLLQLSLRRQELNLSEADEKSLVEALDMLNLATQVKNVHAKTYELVKVCYETLEKSGKTREREHSCSYVISGEFIKSSGSLKSWKNRFFVADDSKITYFKDKAAWLNGPCQGVAKNTKGTVEFSTIQKVVTHSFNSHCEYIKPDQKPKKIEKAQCLHVITAERTFNFLAPEGSNATSKWAEKLDLAVKEYHLRKQLKRWLKENSNLLSQESGPRVILPPPRIKSKTFTMNADERKAAEEEAKKWENLAREQSPEPFPKPILSPQCHSEEEYKAYMIKRFEYEAWENNIILLGRKLKQESLKDKSGAP